MLRDSKAQTSRTTSLLDNIARPEVCVCVCVWVGGWSEMQGVQGLPHCMYTHTHIHMAGDDARGCFATVRNQGETQDHLYQSVHVQETITKHHHFYYDNRTHLAASTETVFLTPSHTEGPQSPFSLVQFKKLGEEDEANQVRKGCRGNCSNCLVPSAQHCLGCHSL